MSEPLSKIVGRYVELTKHGREWMSLSPFAPERTPSFTVNDEKGFYHCFASGEHGDAARFVRRMQELGMVEREVAA